MKEKSRQPLFEGAGSFLIIVFGRKFQVQILPIFLKEQIIFSKESKLDYGIYLKNKANGTEFTCKKFATHLTD